MVYGEEWQREIETILDSISNRYIFDLSPSARQIAGAIFTEIVTESAYPERASLFLYGLIDFIANSSEIVDYIRRHSSDNVITGRTVIHLVSEFSLATMQQENIFGALSDAEKRVVSLIIKRPRLPVAAEA